jgi:hypothetical protein
MGCQFCGGLLMTLDSLPSYTYCTQCKKRPDPLPLLDRPLVDPETGETPPLSPARRIADAVELLKVSPEQYRKHLEGSWLTEPDDAA